MDRGLSDVKHGTKPTRSFIGHRSTNQPWKRIHLPSVPYTAVNIMTWITIALHKKDLHLLFVLRSGDGFVCMYTVSSYEVGCSSAS